MDNAMEWYDIAKELPSQFLEQVERIWNRYVQNRDELSAYYDQLPSSVFQADLNHTNILLDKKGKFAGIYDFNLCGKDVFLNYLLREVPYIYKGKKTKCLQKDPVLDSVLHALSVVKDIYHFNDLERKAALPLWRCLKPLWWPSIQKLKSAIGDLEKVQEALDDVEYQQTREIDFEAVMGDYKIVPLPKEQWQGTIIPMRYETEEYYDVTVEPVGNGAEGFHINITKQRFDSPVCHYPEEYDFPDKLYQAHWEKAYAWGIVRSDGERQELLACIETCPEEWSNRLMITELWVHEDLRRKGVGHALMQIAKEQATLEHRRAIILETQSCNVGAISFYRHEGFEIIGLDTCCYSNRDLERKEVRINMGYFPRKKKLARESITIRKETEQEYHQTEEVALRAFWNKHGLGCDEHLLVHKLRDSDVYLPELSRVAVVDNEIAGVICYAKAKLKKDEKEKEILLFGPLCVAPQWQGCGVGGVLLEETLKLAKEAGYEGVVIFGDPDYYPLHGFQTCDKYGITTADGRNFDAFMGIELVEGGLSGFGGSFHEPEVFENLSEEENEQFTKYFNPPAKQKFPGQWD